MDLGYEGRVVWVLGASSGLGLGCARAFAREGASVAISARNESNLRRAAADLEAETGARVIAVPVDVGDGDGIDAAAMHIADELGAIDVLISNGGGPAPGSYGALDDPRGFYDAFTLTTASAWRLSKAVVTGMEDKGRGCIIFITSWSTKEIIPPLFLSNTMRAAVVGMAKTMSKELGPKGIRVLCMAPGRFDTPRLRHLDEATATATGRSVDEVRSESQSQIPLGRYGDPEEFGNVAAFLASERASYLTGITVLVDGGMLNGLLS
jgi:3-oxoacyl-[acyl-carrier protein] reductase